MHVEKMAHFHCCSREVMGVFVVKKMPKAHIKIMHFPQFTAHTNYPLGFTIDQVVEAQHAF